MEWHKKTNKRYTQFADNSALRRSFEDTTKIKGQTAAQASTREEIAVYLTAYWFLSFLGRLFLFRCIPYLCLQIYEWKSRVKPQ